MLKELQHQLISAIAHPLPDDLAETAIADKLKPLERLSIYQNNYLAVATGLLQQIYPVCSELVGEQFFTAMSRYYAFQHHDQQSTLNNYGQKFADFIDDFKPAQQLPYLGDVARLEWQLHNCYYTSAITPAHPTLLKQLQDPLQATTIHVSLQPNISLLESRFPIDKIWLMNQANSNIKHVDLDDGVCQLVVYNTGPTQTFETIDALQWQLLSQLQQPTDLVTILEINLPALQFFHNKGWLSYRKELS